MGNGPALEAGLPSALEPTVIAVVGRLLHSGATPLGTTVIPRSLVLAIASMALLSACASGTT